MVTLTDDENRQEGGSEDTQDDDGRDHAARFRPAFNANRDSIRSATKSANDT